MFWKKLSPHESASGQALLGSDRRRTNGEKEVKPNRLIKTSAAPGQPPGAALFVNPFRRLPVD
jgi:hypothetical protein